MTNLDHLNVVATICDTGSFQLASEKLNKARSAVSYSVKQVEDFYQVQIFDRSTYRPTLTREGRALLAQIRHLLDQAQQFEDFVRDLKGEVETELRIGVSSNFPIPRLAKLLKELKREFPSTTLHLEIETASGERQLMAEKVDIAIFAAPTRSPFIDYRQITQMSFPLVAAPELVGSNPALVSKTELGRHPQVVVKSSDEKAPDTGLLGDAPKWFVTDMATKKELILAGLGWGRLPDHMVEQEVSDGSLEKLSTLGELSLPICLTKRAGHHLGTVGRRIWEQL
ncbi:LysR family transcriptional regulator [Shimia sp.]|jgi:DNA-binding transcriptional LysR family regulator|uniref:LysR family transcriptional regulator n=1 Tax=unclassified Shimia TaxID=2630038 RepID=UPI0025DA1DBF|nr:LysR family transcriptional regulator [Shimia sp.]MCH2067159.1 LysR family transcriptional regulator [Shimia sp.]